MTKVVPTEDGHGYHVVVGNRRAFVSSYHLVPDKEAPLHKLNKEDAMSRQHPLTDDIIRYDKKLGCQDFGAWIYTENDLRAVADWQLEEVMTKVELKLKEWRMQGYVAGADACEDFFEEVMQELRPQQQQENNQ